VAASFVFEITFPGKMVVPGKSTSKNNQVSSQQSAVSKQRTKAMNMK